MKTLLRGGLAVLLAASVVIVAHGQVQIERKIQIEPGQPGKIQIQIQPGQPGKIQIQPIQIQPVQPGLIAPVFNANPLGLLENKDVQKDLKLSEEQTKTVGDLAKKYQDGLKDLPKGRDGIKKRQELANSIKQEADGVLKADQSKRVKQLEVQQKGLNAFFDQTLMKDLGLTDEQKGKVRDAIKDMNAKRIELLKDLKGNREEIQKKTAELTRTSVTEFVKGLGDEQRKKWQDIAGEPFQGVLPAAGGLGGIIRPLPIEIQPQPRPLPKKIEPKIL